LWWLQINFYGTENGYLNDVLVVKIGMF